MVSLWNNLKDRASPVSPRETVEYRVNEIKIFDRLNVDYFLLLQTLRTSLLGINNSKE